MLLAQIATAGTRWQALGALRHRDFRWFWLSNMSQAAGQSMQFLILGWLVLEITESSTQLGLMIFLYGVPNLALVIFGGIVADRLDRRWLLVVTQIIVAALIAAIAITTTAHIEALWHVYAVACVLGAVQGFNMPARLAIVSDLVDRDEIMNAVALIGAITNVGRVVGPAVAGAVVALVGIGPALFLNSGCYLVAVLLLLPMSGHPSVKEPRPTAVVRDLWEGFSYLWTTPVAFTVVGMGFAFGLFAAAYLQVLPAFAKLVLGAGADGAGLLISAAGLGSLFGSLVLAFLGNFRHKNWMLLGMAVTFSVALLFFAWSPWFWVSWVILVAVGVGFMGFISVGTTVLQLTVPPELLGRILSLWLLSASLHYMGALPLGVVAETFSWPISISGGAILFMTAVLVLGVWRPTLRRMMI